MYYKQYAISFCDDCGENEGGIFCQVHNRGCDDDSIDSFAIPKNILLKDREEYVKKWMEANYG